MLTTSEMPTIDREAGAGRSPRPEPSPADAAARPRRRRPPALSARGSSARWRARETFEVTAQASDGATALALIRRHEPDVALLDVRMPGMDGIDVVAALARYGPPVPVVLLSAFDDEQLVAAGLEAGAAAYVDKTADRDAICRDVAEAARARETRSPSADPRRRRPRPRPPAGLDAAPDLARARAAAAGPRRLGQARAGVPHRSRRAHPPAPPRQHPRQARRRRPRRGAAHRTGRATSSADVSIIGPRSRARRPAVARDAHVGRPIADR